jgi:hypothetical protein
MTGALVTISRISTAACQKYRNAAPSSYVTLVRSTSGALVVVVRISACPVALV